MISVDAYVALSVTVSAVVVEVNGATRRIAISARQVNLSFSMWLLTLNVNYNISAGRLVWDILPTKFVT